MKNLVVIILAAGKGKRMFSSLAKVLHPLAGSPMLTYVLDAVGGLGPEKTIMVTGYQEERVQAVALGYPVEFVSQPEPLGTGHAVLQAKGMLENFKGNILVLNGDTPLLTTAALRKLVKEQQENNCALTMLTAEVPDPCGYGRILRDSSGRVSAVIEEKDANTEQKQIREVATGVYCFSSPLIFELLKEVTPDNSQAEYYLTDVVKIALLKGKSLGAQKIDDYRLMQGINNRAQLAAAESMLRERINEKWLNEGVSMKNPSTVYIDKNVTIGKDTVLYPQVILEGNTKIGCGCVVGPNNFIKDSKIGSGVHVQSSCVITESDVSDDVAIGPFAHLRPKAVIEKNAKIGNFVEVKKSRVGEGSKVSHLSYIGDAQIGEGVNVGAGTITCNYDGKNKFTTVIEDGVFIGSDTQLIAPVTIGHNSWIGAGSTITKDVPPYSLATSRVPQNIKEDWVKRKGKI